MEHENEDPFVRMVCTHFHVTPAQVRGEEPQGSSTEERLAHVLDTRPSEFAPRSSASYMLLRREWWLSRLAGFPVPKKATTSSSFALDVFIRQASLLELRVSLQDNPTYPFLAFHVPLESCFAFAQKQQLTLSAHAVAYAVAIQLIREHGGRMTKAEWLTQLQKHDVSVAAAVSKTAPHLLEPFSSNPLAQHPLVDVDVDHLAPGEILQETYRRRHTGGGGKSGGKGGKIVQEDAFTRQTEWQRQEEAEENKWIGHIHLLRERKTFKNLIVFYPPDRYQLNEGVQELVHMLVELHRPL
jgi:hypothetical protein